MEYDFLTVKEVANILKLNKMTVYRYIKAGKMEAYKVGKDYRITKKEFDNFLEKIKTNQTTRHPATPIS